MLVIKKPRSGRNVISYFTGLIKFIRFDEIKKTCLKDIEDAQIYLKKKDKEVRNKVADIIQKASEIINED